MADLDIAQTFAERGYITRGDYRAQKESRMPRPASPSPAPPQRAATQPQRRQARG